MSSSFNGLNLFDSGPHRFAVDPMGEFVVQNASLDGSSPGSFPNGKLETVVRITGRLISDSEAGLWTLRDAIQAQLTDPPQTGTLIDQHGRSWNDMAFVRVAWGDRTDRGRKVSIAYEAKFIDFLNS